MIISIKMILINKIIIMAISIIEIMNQKTI